MTFEKMIDQCDNLTPIENTIVAYIINHTETVLECTLQELSAQIFVSKSAIHRFCKKIGLHGFNDLKVKLAKEKNQPACDTHYINVNYPFQKADTPKTIADKLLTLYEVTINDTYNCIDFNVLQTVAKILDHADTIDIYTHAHNFYIAENFQDKMLTIGKNVQCIQTFYKQRLYALAGDQSHVAIILSYSGKASWILPIMQKLKEKQLTIIQIGKIGSHYYPQYVAYHLGISDGEHLRDRISQFSSHIALQYIMDVLYSCIYNIRRTENMNYLTHSIDYMDDRKE